jgi:hypothetical protein
MSMSVNYFWKIRPTICNFLRWCHWHLAPAMTHHPDDGGSKHLWKVGQYLPDDTGQHPRRQSSHARRRENPKSHLAWFCLIIVRTSIRLFSWTDTEVTWGHWPLRRRTSTARRTGTTLGVWAAASGTRCRQGSHLHSRTAGQSPLRLVYQRRCPVYPVSLMWPENQRTELQFADVLETLLRCFLKAEVPKVWSADRHWSVSFTKVICGGNGFVHASWNKCQDICKSTRTLLSFFCSYNRYVSALCTV